MGVILKLQGKEPLHYSYLFWNSLKLEVADLFVKYLCFNNYELYVNYLNIFEERYPADLTLFNKFLLQNILYLPFKLIGIIYLLESSSDTKYYTYSKCGDILNTINLLEPLYVNSSPVYQKKIHSFKSFLEHSIEHKKTIFIL